MKLLVLLDMDGTVLMGRSLRALTRAFGLEAKIVAIDREKREQGLSEREAAEKIARLFAGRALGELYAVFDTIPLTPGASWWIRRVRSRGGKVGLVSDSWRPLVERLAHRLGVDAVWANDLEIVDGYLTGRLLPPPLPETLPPGCRRHAVCKLYALHALGRRFQVSREDTVAVGDGPVDACMLREAGLGIALNPKTEEVAQVADLIVYGDFYDLAAAVEARRERHGKGVRPRIVS